jgi:hypothetical protein
MVVGVINFTNQIEIATGGRHAGRIVRPARGPAPPPRRAASSLHLFGLMDFVFARAIQCEQTFPFFKHFSNMCLDKAWLISYTMFT